MLYRTALDILPDSFSVMNNLGAVYLLQSKDQLALSTLNAALAIQPDAVEARANAANLLHVRFANCPFCLPCGLSVASICDREMFRHNAIQPPLTQACVMAVASALCKTWVRR